jgi:hypothetical protein
MIKILWGFGNRSWRSQVGIHPSNPKIRFPGRIYEQSFKYSADPILQQAIIEYAEWFATEDCADIVKRLKDLQAFQ